MIVAPDRDLRASIAFALGAEGFGVDQYRDLASALTSAGAADCACAVIDENAFDPREDLSVQLRGLVAPIVLLVDGLKLPFGSAVPRVVTKPLLGRVLTEAVVATIARTSNYVFPRREVTEFRRRPI
jgi:hypothetical protein